MKITPTTAFVLGSVMTLIILLVFLQANHSARTSASTVEKTTSEAGFTFEVPDGWSSDMIVKNAKGKTIGSLQCPVGIYGVEGRVPLSRETRTFTHEGMEHEIAINTYAWENDVSKRVVSAFITVQNKTTQAFLCELGLHEDKEIPAPILAGLRQVYLSWQ